MTFDAIANRGEYLSAYYLAEVLPRDLKKKDEGLLARWAKEESDGRLTPRVGIRALRRDYLDTKTDLADLGDAEKRRTILHDLHTTILTRLGYLEPGTTHREPVPITVERANHEYEVLVAHAEPGIVAIECGWATDPDEVVDPDEDAGRLRHPFDLDRRERIEAGFALAGWLFGAEHNPPRYVLILCGGVLVLTDRLTWGERRYLAVALDSAYARNDTRNAGELDVIAALFSADALRPPPEGGAEPLAGLVAGSRQNAVGVSSELREGIRLSVEHIANEVLARIAQAGVRPEQLMEPAELGRSLAREALRYLYRILFLLYAEARPDLGVLPVDYPEYMEGYSLARLGDLVTRPLVGEAAANGFHLYESLDLLFHKVNNGYRERGTDEVTDATSEGESIRFEPLRSNLFLDGAIKHIGPEAFTHPDDDPDEPDARTIDTRLRNATLHTVLRLLMLTRGNKKERGGFISYAQLGISHLGAVYEGLMSYTGFIADEDLYEVAKGGDASDGSWMIRASTVHAFPDEVFVTRVDEDGRRDRVYYPVGNFVYRLAGRDRQTSASYYTPPSLTEVTVKLALKQLIEENPPQRPEDVLTWTICEPALGSGAFLNEAINQVAAEYLRRVQEREEQSLDPEQYATELQKVKAYIALHNCYGVDLNEMAVELAEVSIWLNVMHAGLRAPWFGLHLRHGNSLIGAGRRTYPKKDLAKRAWLSAAPQERPLRDGKLPSGEIHHFLLPADGWGTVAKEKEARTWATEDAARLRDWRRGILHPDTKRAASYARRLEGLAGRVEMFWDLVRQRIKLSEDKIRRHIEVWGATGLPDADDSALREEILAALEAVGAPYWRLKTLMDAWCALWFWPLEHANLLDGTAPEYGQSATSVSRIEEKLVPEEDPLVDVWADGALFGLAELGLPEQLTLPSASKPKKLKLSEERITLRLARKVPLARLDDWLDFCEALLGTQDVPEDSFVATFHNLETLEEYEDELLRWTGMETPTRVAERFPWARVVEEIAAQQGFFHWELQFAQVFANGGFDLQVGNPPWVRPRWDEGGVMAERDPWFKLEDSPPAEIWRERKATHLEDLQQQREFLNELAVSSGVIAFLGATSTYPLLAGTQPDLYEAFMCRTWNSLGRGGVISLIHQDGHLVGTNDGKLRAATYSHLRLHAHFLNRRLIFPDINWNRPFSVNIYGAPKVIGFDHICWLFDPTTLIGSIDHDGSGDAPVIKYNGYWDLRPHRSRLVHVDADVLTLWRRITADTNVPLAETKLLYTVTTVEQTAVAALAAWEHRLGMMEPAIASGYNESGGKAAGLIRAQFAEPGDWRDVVLRGPQFAVATPMAKQPPHTLHTDKPIDLVSLPADAIATTDYIRACDRDRYLAVQERWTDHDRLRELRESAAAVEAAEADLLGASGSYPSTDQVEAYLSQIASRPYTDFYRVAWREMIPDSTERSLFVALVPPGPAHIHAVRTMALPTAKATALVAGFWSALPMDYALRIAGRPHLDVSDAKTMPAPQTDHPLASALLLRTLRLNCLTTAYTGLWRELFDPEWQTSEGWAASWESMPPLHDVGPEWDSVTPLRTERERRSALVEIDALVAAWLGISADQLVAIYLSRFPQLVDYESEMWFDVNGRRLARNYNQYGYGQTKEHFVQLMAHLEEPDRVLPPEGYSAPFFKADRPKEMRQAHAVFTARLEAAKKVGWRP
ncbi:class I SAM-dependent DNA methyltransferase [Actinoplanes flavus]|uniref:site-specific DNA-methyltransferase (adenine-specific) n=1 Tax=Actinoplanes flavus TaxID=2820290 RepID=A0ABS3USU0_9ACTN|nr:class I SAM-dependent DNA methyltransferase [Actinoplanes flavus]MBO3741622.1 class I SAM-dependent DNA methyltransferase [Actinoplanes flavus]